MTKRRFATWVAEGKQLMRFSSQLKYQLHILHHFSRSTLNCNCQFCINLCSLRRVASLPHLTHRWEARVLSQKIIINKIHHSLELIATVKQLLIFILKLTCKCFARSTQITMTILRNDEDNTPKMILTILRKWWCGYLENSINDCSIQSKTNFNPFLLKFWNE